MRWDYFALLLSNLRSRRSGKNSENIHSCLNCGLEAVENYIFCPTCGQRVRNSKISVGVLISELFTNVFNLDSSLYRSLIYLPIPAYLSKKYINGERKHYLNPIRFFFFALILFFALFAYYWDVSSLETFKAQEYAKIERSEMLSKFDSLFQTDDFALLDPITIDSLRIALFKDVKLPDADTMYNIGVGHINFIEGIEEIKILRKDMYYRPIPEIIDELNIESYWEKIIIQQFIRINRDVKGALSFFIGNGIWVIILSIFLLAFVMKFFYLKSNRYFIEHAIILFHTHAFAFTLGSILLLLELIYSDVIQQSLWILLTSTIYIILSIKIYYKQGWIKTIFKFVFLSLFYLVIMSFLLIIVLFLSILFFN